LSATTGGFQFIEDILPEFNSSDEFGLDIGIFQEMFFQTKNIL
jgi:hypothetical protein